MGLFLVGPGTRSRRVVDGLTPRGCGVLIRGYWNSGSLGRGDLTAGDRYVRLARASALSDTLEGFDDAMLP
jgi:hypothetical protein